MTYPFNPRFYNLPGHGDFYEDGCVTGAVDRYDHVGQPGVVIHEWSSMAAHGRGHTTRALQWMRAQGITHITANGVGLIEDGAADISTAYWLHMHKKGLVDVLLDDAGLDITPEKVNES